MASFFGGAAKTFKQKKSKKGGEFSVPQAFSLQHLSAGNMQNFVRAPDGEDVNEWLAVNTMDFFNLTNILYGTITEFCTRERCPTMSAGPNYEYLWAEGASKKKAIKVSAPEYCDYLMSWVQQQLSNEAVFPKKIGVPFPKNFLTVVKTIFKRLFRVYAHIYYTHLPEIIALEEEPHLNTVFLHFWAFMMQFHLVDRKETDALLAVHERLSTSADGSEQSGGGAGASS